MKYLILITSILLSGCAGTRVGVYHDFNGYNGPEREILILQVPIYKKKQISVEYAHVSNIFRGAPANNKKDASYDAIGVSYEFK